MNLITYNVNGLRAVLNKGFVDWLKSSNPDLLCLQEIKASPDQVPVSIFEDLGYFCYWFPAQKKGYSGTAIFSKIKPKNIAYGCGNEQYDFEGRTIRLDFDGFSAMSIYAPSGTTGDIRQTFKYEWMDFFYSYISDLKKSIPNLLIAGDFNICNHPIDIHNPKSNANSSGFLPEERAWMSKLLASGGLTDTFRFFEKGPHFYTWWSFRANARAKNLGWRIDYILADNAFDANLQNAKILSDISFSDHCPVSLSFEP